MTRPLDLSPQQFRALADRITGLATDYLEQLDRRSIKPHASGEETVRLFEQPCPEQGMGEHALDALTDVLACSRAQNGRFFGYVAGSGEPVAATADLLASVTNQIVTSWRSGPAAMVIERTVVGWLAEAIGCKGFTGTLCGGGSPANLMGLAMAREAIAPANRQGAQGGVVYASAEAHMSIPKAMSLLGLGRDHLRSIPVDSEFRMDVGELERAITADLAAGKKPVAIVATAGTVNTGAIDPLAQIARIAQRHHLWLHVDGAYGALASLATPDLFRGLSEADSISLDPHKWLYQPVDVGCLLYRNPEAARATFAQSGDYARSLSNDPIEGFMFFEESMELSRRFRALRLWLSLRYHGLAAFRQSLADDLALAQKLAERVRREAQLELLAPVPLSAVCFRWRGEAKDLNAHNAAILDRVNRRGRVYLSNATIHGKFALRACITNHRTTEADVNAVVDEVLSAA